MRANTGLTNQILIVASNGADLESTVFAKISEGYEIVPESLNVIGGGYAVQSWSIIMIRDSTEDTFTVIEV